jgi:hypothetical protein
MEEVNLHFGLIEEVAYVDIHLFIGLFLSIYFEHLS